MGAAAPNYGDRLGYAADFLLPGEQDGQVFLPALSDQLLATAARLAANPDAYVLPYRGFSLVMHRQRRFAIYSAANVDFDHRFAMTRPKDRWLMDPRIGVESQVGASFYEKNQFDRGHLTRREDMEYGKSEGEALAAAADTNHWTNCTPQHAKFNEGKQLWQGIERHLLEGAVAPGRFRAQVITGPVFDATDPLLDGFPGIPYPVRYWKVAAAINASGRLFATAYVLDQRGVISEFGLREAPQVPFTPYKTFQTTIAEIERLTQLTFTGSKRSTRVPLSDFDPLAKRPKLRGAPERACRELGSVHDIVID